MVVRMSSIVSPRQSGQLAGAQARARRFHLGSDEDAAVGQPLPVGGPLALHCASLDKPSPALVCGVADRMTIGRTRDGLVEVRLGLAPGAALGTEIRLTAAPGGVEATMVVPPEAARAVVEGQLASLGRSLARRGIQVAKLSAVGMRRRAPAQGGRGSP